MINVKDKLVNELEKVVNNVSDTSRKRYHKRNK